MLVLSRRTGEGIFVAGGDIEIVVVAIKGHVVRLGISAPFDVPIRRQEVQPSKTPIISEKDNTLQLKEPEK